MFKWLCVCILFTLIVPAVGFSQTLLGYVSDVTHQALGNQDRFFNIAPCEGISDCLGIFSRGSKEPRLKISIIYANVDISLVRRNEIKNLVIPPKILFTPKRLEKLTALIKVNLENEKGSPDLSKYVSYEVASKWGKFQHISSAREWYSYSRPEYIPRRPEKVYAQWTSWLDFLDNPRTYASYREAQSWALENGIHTQNQWEAFRPKPREIPSNPRLTYINVWPGWKNFLPIEPLIEMNFQFCNEQLSDINLSAQN